MLGLRVLLLEDDAACRELLHQAVAALGDGNAQIVDAHDLAAGRRCLAEASFDLFLADLALPDGLSLDLIRQARTLREPPAVLVVSSLSDEATIVQAIVAGACGYVCKHDTSADIARALQLAVQGGSSISPTIAHRLLLLLRQQASAGAAGQDVSLTARENDVLTLAAKGHTYRRIAELTGTLPSTVYTHVRHIYEKLQVSSLQEALYQARLRRLV
ncbi:LuxR family two component transcriptional regulator [Tahibacter aquaticus]|jgi:DNA-binding NarL/FixJ family response regulator|uniref:LuxR family two component transcriptional regulator n=1 Tax=Tahibacter aquaticus TaxID=520092 RepID=A0A4R6Z0H5_9GAMM|nr:response regulator transcription factor [Tahibacter aquaticus]TDR44924.1 LuxR family two component transcriptional regulator [Tahibacter aquaticus]